MLRAARKGGDMDDGDVRYERRLVEEASKLRVELAGVEVRLTGKIAQTTDRIAQSEVALRQEISALDVRMERAMGGLRSDVVRWSFVFWIGQVVAMTAIMSALLR